MIALPGNGPQLTYRIWHQLIVPDLLVVEVSEDGLTWEIVDWVSGSSATLPPGVGLPAGGVRGVDLSAHAGQPVRIRFRILTDALFEADGAYIDEVEITQVELFQYDGTQYGFLDGTSFAAPHVSGVAALLMSQRPELTHLEVRDLILDTVDLKPSLSGKVATGGRLNAQKALEAAIATLCGDVDDDGVIGVGDRDLFRDVLAGLNTFTAPGEAKCTVIGTAGPCSVLDLTVIRRKVEGPELPPGTAPVCAAAVGA